MFLAVDLFLFYFAWELMLVPMYFLIAIWGHERRIYAAMKFFLFTQLSGLLMLIAILALYFLHHQSTGIFTFEYGDLMSTPLSSTAALWIMLGFFAAFAVKLPDVSISHLATGRSHRSPDRGQRDSGRTFLKTGAYGMLRFVMPLFPGRPTSSLPSLWFWP